jgi:hypothetical protein
MGVVDKRGRLEQEVFEYRRARDGTIFISWRGRVVTTVRGDQARKLLSRLEGAGAREVQLALAKATGHFKHGNER